MTTRTTRFARPRSAPASAPARGSAQDRFDRRVGARRRRTWKLLGVLALLVALGAGAWWALWRSDWLLVEDVVVTGTEERWHTAILEAADIPMSEPMVEVDTGTAESAVREVAIVREVSIARSWPHTMTIQVTPREPVLAAREGSSFALVDVDGATIETVSALPEKLPSVVARGSAGSSPQAYQSAYAVLSALPETIADQATEIEVSGSHMITLTLGERTLVWGGPEEPELKAEVAQALLRTDATTIDVSAPRTPVTEGGSTGEETDTADGSGG